MVIFNHGSSASSDTPSYHAIPTRATLTQKLTRKLCSRRR